MLDNTDFSSRHQSEANQPHADGALAGIPEIIKAKGSLRNNKSAGLDNITAELLKSCPTTTALILQPPFASIRESETISKDWQEGLLVTIHKKTT